jgi:hypothetical protein
MAQWRSRLFRSYRAAREDTLRDLLKCKACPPYKMEPFLRDMAPREHRADLPRYLTRIYKTNNKLRGPQSASELYRLIDRHLSTKFSVNFCG